MLALERKSGTTRGKEKNSFTSVSLPRMAPDFLSRGNAQKKIPGLLYSISIYLKVNSLVSNYLGTTGISERSVKNISTG